jgi:hypothetical protein
VQSEHTANVGTPIYMAPELITDEEVGTCGISMVAVYAFGILMWAVLITRTTPYVKVCKERRLTIWTLVSCVCLSAPQGPLASEGTDGSCIGSSGLAGLEMGTVVGGWWTMTKPQGGSHKATKTQGLRPGARRLLASRLNGPGGY